MTGHGQVNRLLLVKTEDGYKITPYDAQFEQQRVAAGQGMRQYRNALKELTG